MLQECKRSWSLSACARSRAFSTHARPAKITLPWVGCISIRPVSSLFHIAVCAQTPWTIVLPQLSWHFLAHAASHQSTCPLCPSAAPPNPCPEQYASQLAYRKTWNYQKKHDRTLYKVCGKEGDGHGTRDTWVFIQKQYKILYRGRDRIYDEVGAGYLSEL